MTFREGLGDKKEYPQKIAWARSSTSNEMDVTIGSLPAESLSYNTFLYLTTLRQRAQLLCVAELGIASALKQIRNNSAKAGGITQA